VEQILFGVISGVISYYVAPALPQISTTAAWLQYANEPAIRFVGVLAVTWYVLLLLVNWLRTQRQRKNASIGVIGFGPKRMRYVRDKGVIRHFGVDWKYKYGRQSLDDEMSALAKGPFCPECGSEMVTDKEERIIRGGVQIRIER